MATSLRATALHKHRHGRDSTFTLEIEHLELGSGAALALVGPNGCGKSTAVDLLGLGLAPDSAERFELVSDQAAPIDLAQLWRAGRSDRLAALRARHFGYVPQVGALLPFLTVRANIALPQQLAGRPDPGAVQRLATELGLDGLLDEWPGHLSVGQRQRAAIARAIAHQPDFVIADEPTSALDPDSARRALQLLVSLARDRRIGLLLVSHDLEQLASLSVPIVPRTSLPGRHGWLTRLGGSPELPSQRAMGLTA